MITCKIFDMYLFLQLAVSVSSMQVFLSLATEIMDLIFSLLVFLKSLVIE